eukprot:PhF_6_TR14518/c0_g1_i1/m.23057
MAQAVWSWKDDANNFIPYDAVFASRVEKSFQTGAASEVIAYSGTKYDIDFVNMTQKNQESGKTRNIRRDVALWFFFEDSGKAKPYPATESAKLEQHATASSSSTFAFNMFNTNYTMDMT